MKTCSKCKEDKPFSDFYKSKNKPDGYAYLCKQCSDVYNKGSRDKDPNKYLGYRQEYKKILAEKVAEYKSKTGCVVCGENSHPAVLDLHHLDPSIKEDSPSSMQTSWDRWVKEAEKCIVLCANCHRKVHAGVLDIS